MRSRRALLFMPGDDRRKIEKGAGLGVDAIIMDLEDGLAFNRKQAGRESVAAALREVDFGRSERLVRVNPVLPGGLYTEDILQTAAFQPDGYVLPKVEHRRQIEEASRLLAQMERKYNFSAGYFQLLVIIESARGVVNLRQIITGNPRLSAVIFGAEDLAGDMGAQRTPDGWEVFYARSAVVTYAKAYELDAIDTPYVHLEDIDGLIAETEQARYMGYDGKLAIHPRQIEPIQRVFTPQPEDIARAQRLIDAYYNAQDSGSGVIALDGRMVDWPMVREAELVLERARAAGVI